MMLMITGCGGTTTIVTSADSGLPPTSVPTTLPPTSSTPAVQPGVDAKVGSTLDLQGESDGEQMSVTLLAVVDPAKPSNPYDRPSRGKRFIGVQIRMQNSGSAVYSDSPSNGAQLIDTEDQGWDPTIGGVDPDIGNPKITPGDSRVGLITFAVPNGVKVATLQFALDSGFADQAGEWMIDHTQRHAADSGTPSATSEPTAGPGDTITLNGYDQGETMAVTVVKVVDPAKSSDPYDRPSRGHRYVAVELRLSNAGTTTYNDSPSNGAALVDTQSHSYQSNFGSVEPDLGSPRIAPGDSRVGYITFEVPKQAKLRLFQFALDSGFAEQTGEWALH